MDTIPQSDLRRYAIQRVPQVLNVTADLSRVYARERLWFVSRGGTLIAIMALSSDDAWMDIDGTYPSRRDLERLTAGMSTEEIFAATEALKHNPLYGIQYYQATWACEDIGLRRVK